MNEEIFAKLSNQLVAQGVRRALANSLKNGLGTIFPQSLHAFPQTLCKSETSIVFA
ncbi:MAG: hypothetical protein R3C54_07040 [Parvularculaceae bacterium]